MAMQTLIDSIIIVVVDKQRSIVAGKTMVKMGMHIVFRATNLTKTPQNTMNTASNTTRGFPFIANSVFRY